MASPTPRRLLVAQQSLAARQPRWWSSDSAACRFAELRVRSSHATAGGGESQPARAPTSQMSLSNVARRCVSLSQGHSTRIEVESGRASGGDSVSQSVELSVVPGTIKTKKKD